MTPRVEFWDIFLLMLGAFLAEIIVFVPLEAFGLSRFSTINLSVMVGSIWWLFGYQKLSRARGWKSLPERFSPVGGKVIAAGVFGGLALAFVPLGLAKILELSGIKITDVPVQPVLPSELSQLPLSMAVVVILGPLSEEIMFRGLLLDWMMQKMAVWPAALAVSLLFAVLHNIAFKNGLLVWIGFAVRFLFSLGASFFAIRYRSLRAPFVMHATLNGCVCLVTALRGPA